MLILYTSSLFSSSSRNCENTKQVEYRQSLMLNNNSSSSSSR